MCLLCQPIEPTQKCSSLTCGALAWVGSDPAPPCTSHSTRRPPPLAMGCLRRQHSQRHLTGQAQRLTGQARHPTRRHNIPLTLMRPKATSPTRTGMKQEVAAPRFVRVSWDASEVLQKDAKMFANASAARVVTSAAMAAASFAERASGCATGGSPVEIGAGGATAKRVATTVSAAISSAGVCAIY